MAPPDAPLPSDIPAPFVDEQMRVLPAWIDVNGHMNVAWYVHAFDQAFDRVFQALGMSLESLIRGGGSTFTVEMHIGYRRELRLGEPLRITTQLIGHDAKRLHFFQRMYQDETGELAATSEWLLLYIDMNLRRSAEMPPNLRERVARLQAAHDGLPRPEELGRSISLASRRSG